MTSDEMVESIHIPNQKKDIWKISLLHVEFCSYLFTSHFNKFLKSIRPFSVKEVSQFKQRVCITQCRRNFYGLVISLSTMIFKNPSFLWKFQSLNAHENITELILSKIESQNSSGGRGSQRSHKSKPPARGRVANP